MDKPIYFKNNTYNIQKLRILENRVDRSLRENGRARIDDRTDNPNAVHATIPDTRVTVTDCGDSHWVKSLS
jgi:hypothetical protein